MTRVTTATAIALVLSLGATGPALAAGENQTASTSPTMGSVKAGGANCPAPSVVDTNDDGFVTDEEADEHNAQIFDALDSDGDDAVSRFEYLECHADVTGLYRTTSRDSGVQDRTKDSYSALDTDKSGDVSRKEYIEGLQQHYQQLDKKVDEDEFAESMNGMSASGQSADIDGDGKISADEAAADAAASFKRMDSDGNGQLSQDEWLQSELRKRADESFNAMDSNDDQKLSRKEFNQARSEAMDQAATGDQPATVWIYRVYEVY